MDDVKPTTPATPTVEQLERWATKIEGFLRTDIVTEGDRIIWKSDEPQQIAAFLRSLKQQREGSPLERMAMCLPEGGSPVFHDVHPDIVADMKRRTKKTVEFWRRAKAAENELEKVSKEAFDAMCVNDGWAMEVDRLKHQLAQSSNYVADKECRPTAMWFNNGRTVEIVVDADGAYLETGLSGKVKQHQKAAQPQPTSEPAEEFWRVVGPIMDERGYSILMDYSEGSGLHYSTIYFDGGKYITGKGETKDAAKAALLAELRRRGEVE